MTGIAPLLGAEALAAPKPHSALAWYRSAKPVPYPAALTAMEMRVAEIGGGESPETVWLLQHPPLYTAGTSADPKELLAPDKFPVFQTGRGGRYTYHGPGQRVAYVMLDLAARGGDVRAFVQALQDWLMGTLKTFGVTGSPMPGEVGVWVDGAKIASLGIRIRRGITFHGVSLNVSPDLEHFSGIVPCGLEDGKVTSLKALGIETDMDAVDRALMANFPESLSEATSPRSQ
ncbi:lipoyl(octanoyl) transferase LipB [Methyloligella sp. GL2]|nr:lipoyl(octanoyl) transferase LipB [Methyloligella sp. GL2]